MSVAVALGVSLEVGCSFDDRCSRLARPMFEQMASGRYDECAVLPVPETVEGWRAEHRTARKRTDRAARRGYTAGPLLREEWELDIYRINRSRSERQGRAMASSYQQRQSFGPLPDYRCGRHAIRTTGVWSAERQLVAYLTMYRIGDMVLVSQILGHGDHEAHEIMFLLFQEALGREVGNPGVVVYNRWDSGTDGLRFFKERLGFAPAMVEWLP